MNIQTAVIPATPMPTEAQQIVTTTREQIETLIGRNWPEVQRILEKEEEVKINFAVTITDRETQPGEQAEKSNRVKTSMSFSERFTDAIETTLDDGSQPELELAAAEGE